MEKLERKSIQGVTWNHIAHANGLHNIKKALEILSKKHTIPLYYIHSAEKVFEGDMEFITGLLKNIRHAYKGAFQSKSCTKII